MWGFLCLVMLIVILHVITAVITAKVSVKCPFSSRITYWYAIHVYQTVTETQQATTEVGIYKFSDH